MLVCYPIALYLKETVVHIQLHFLGMRFVVLNKEEMMLHKNIAINLIYLSKNKNNFGQFRGYVCVQQMVFPVHKPNQKLVKSTIFISIRIMLSAAVS